MIKINIVKNRNKIITSIILIGILMIIAISVAREVNSVSHNAAPPQGTSGGACNAVGQWCVRGFGGNYIEHWGVRIGIVHHNAGNRLNGSRTVDIWEGHTANWSGPALLAGKLPGAMHQHPFTVASTSTRFLRQEQTSQQIASGGGISIWDLFNGALPVNNAGQLWAGTINEHFNLNTLIEALSSRSIIISRTSTQQNSNPRHAQFIDEWATNLGNLGIQDEFNGTSFLLSELNEIFRLLNAGVTAEQLMAQPPTCSFTDNRQPPETELHCIYIQFEPLLLMRIARITAVGPNMGQAGCVSAAGCSFADDQLIYGTVGEIAWMSSDEVHSIFESMLRMNSVGLYINRPERPQGFGTSVARPSVVTNNTSAGGNNIRIWQLRTPEWSHAGVAHMWLGDFTPGPIPTTCPEAVDYIRALPESEWESRLNQLRSSAGLTFTNTAGEQVTAGPFNYNMLNPAMFNSAQVLAGQGTFFTPYPSHSCQPGQPCCGTWSILPIEPPPCLPEIHIAECPTDEFEIGVSYFRDNASLECWLEQGVAFLEKISGDSFSSENTGAPKNEVPNSDGDVLSSTVGDAEFCRIFCREEFESSFPGMWHVQPRWGPDGSIVRAGQTFFWGLGDREDAILANIIVRKTCSNQAYEGDKNNPNRAETPYGYRFLSWKRYFLANQVRLIRGFLQYEAATFLVNLGIEAITPSVSSCCLTDYVCPPPGEGSCWCPAPGGIPHANSQSRSISYTPTTDTHVGQIQYNFMTPQTVTVQRASSGSCMPPAEAWIEAQTTQRQNVMNQLIAARDAGRAQWQQAVANEEPVLSRIRRCYNNLLYVYETVVEFIFQEPINNLYGNTRDFHGSWELRKDGLEIFQEPNANYSQCAHFPVYKYICQPTGGVNTNANCELDEAMVRDCHAVTHSSHLGTLHGVMFDINPGEEPIIYYYEPEADFTWYSLRINNELINRTERDDSDFADARFDAFLVMSDKVGATYQSLTQTPKY